LISEEISVNRRAISREITSPSEMRRLEIFWSLLKWLALRPPTLPYIFSMAMPQVLVNDGYEWSACGGIRLPCY